MQEIRDILDLMPLPPEQFPWLPVAGAVAAVVVVIGVLVALLPRRRRTREKGTPEQVAYRKLDALTGASGRALFVELSNVFAAYLHRRLHLNATSMTSVEVLERMPVHLEMDAETSAALQHFLRLCDTGKFGPADSAAADDARAACREAIRQIALAALTKPRVGRAVTEAHATI